METTRNRSAILAQFLRCAVFEIRTHGDMQNAIESINAVAEELEAVARGETFPASSPESPHQVVSTSADAILSDERETTMGSGGEREPLPGTNE